MYMKLVLVLLKPLKTLKKKMKVVSKLVWNKLELFLDNYQASFQPVKPVNNQSNKPFPCWKLTTASGLSPIMLEKKLQLMEKTSLMKFPMLLLIMKANNTYLWDMKLDKQFSKFSLETKLKWQWTFKWHPLKKMHCNFSKVCWKEWLSTSLISWTVLVISMVLLVPLTLLLNHLNKKILMDIKLVLRLLETSFNNYQMIWRHAKPLNKISFLLSKCANLSLLGTHLLIMLVKIWLWMVKI